MKKLSTILIALLLLLSAEGQILRYSNYTAPVPPVETPDFTSEDYEAVYNAFATKPHADTADIFNDFVYSLDSAGFWDRIYYLNVYCGATTEADAVINWVNPGTNDASAMNTPTFYRYRGFDFNGSNQYLNTNFNPNGVVAQDDATAMIYVREDTQEAANVFSAYDGNYFSMTPRNASNQVSWQINQTAGEAQTLAAWNGFWIISRRGSTESECYRNGTSVDTSTDVSTAVPNATFWVGRHASAYGTRETSLFIVTDGVSDSEAANWNTIVTRLVTRLGIGI
jgi:hypothetical protein